MKSAIASMLVMEDGSGLIARTERIGLSFIDSLSVLLLING
jgi:hypothetical protein